MLCVPLVTILCSFFAFVMDIEEAFLHVFLHYCDRDYICFLWLSDGEDPNSDLTTYHYKVLPFGMSSSPFMLHAILDLHLSQFKSQIATDMNKNLYVVNLISSCTSKKMSSLLPTSTRTDK